MSVLNEKNTYDDYVQLMQQIADLKYASAVLQWDQETYMPAKGVNARSRQIATLSEQSHLLFTGNKMTQVLEDLESAQLDKQQQRNVQLTLQDFEKQRKLNAAFVRQMSEAVSMAFNAWIDARKQNDFTVFEPALTKLVALKRQEAELLGYQAHPYNALLDEFEKGATVSELDEIFEEVKAPLYDLLTQIQGKAQPEDHFLHQHFPKQQQWEWGMYLSKELGFDFEAGRQDISEHPFTINFSSQDVRITTRVDENDFANMTWSTIHEVGHGLYEQGLPFEMYGLPLGEYASIGIHESQSRIWENCVGRGKAFWQYYLPKLKEYFPKQFEHVELDHFLKAINKVQPSLIRTEADELTYHFHIIIRYELEKQLIEGSLEVKDIPAYWNESYKKWLNVEVPDDKNGCLQDVHWSHGSFGYFPTYSLGSFYAAQMWEKAKLDMPTLESRIADEGATYLLLDWLRDKVHQYGRMYTSKELVQLVTGKKANSTDFLQYLRSKHV